MKGNDLLNVQSHHRPPDDEAQPEESLPEVFRCKIRRIALKLPGKGVIGCAGHHGGNRDRHAAAEEGGKPSRRGDSFDHTCELLPGFCGGWNRNDDRFRPFASRQEKQGAGVELLVEGYGDFLDTQCFVGCKRSDFRLPCVQLNQAQHPAEALPVSVQGLTVCGNRGVVGTPQLISPRAAREGALVVAEGRGALEDLASTMRCRKLQRQKT